MTHGRLDAGCPALRRLRNLHRAQAPLAGPDLGVQVKRKQAEDLRRHVRECPRCAAHTIAPRATTNPVAPPRRAQARAAPPPPPPRPRPRASDPAERPLRTLGLAKDADTHAIREAYRAHALLYHPDRTTGLPSTARAAAEARMLDLNRAYETLRKLGRA